MTEQDITTEDWIEYKNNATKYLEMHSQYATRKAIQIAIEKQIPKKMRDDGYHHIICNCEHKIPMYMRYEIAYCPYCGQAIKWE